MFFSPELRVSTMQVLRTVLLVLSIVSSSIDSSSLVDLRVWRHVTCLPFHFPFSLKGGPFSSQTKKESQISTGPCNTSEEDTTCVLCEGVDLDCIEHTVLRNCASIICSISRPLNGLRYVVTKCSVISLQTALRFHIHLSASLMCTE